jgi:hypothetical protein
MPTMGLLLTMRLMLVCESDAAGGEDQDGYDSEYSEPPEAHPYEPMYHTIDPRPFPVSRFRFPFFSANDVLK